MNKKDAAIFFNRMQGREGLAKRALQIAKEITESGSYKRAIAGAGQLKVISEISQKADDYWREMADRGEKKELFYVRCPKSIPPILDDAGHLSLEHWEAEKKAEIIK